MIDLKNTKIINLSERLSEDIKSCIVETYYETKTTELAKDIIDQIDKISENYLEHHYKHILGESWKTLVEKYKIQKQRICLISEEIRKKQVSLCLTYFRNGSFTSYRLVHYSKNEYPYIVGDNNISAKFDKCKSKQKLVSLLYKKLDIQDSFVRELMSRGIMTKFSYLPGIDTYDGLKSKYPEIFEIYMQEILENNDNIVLVSEENEIKHLKNFLKC